jgi:hypothetical protein
MLELCTIAYLFAFNLYGLDYMSYWETFADVIWLFGIGVEFWTAIPKEAIKQGDNGSVSTSAKWEKNMQIIALKYLKFYFFIDLMACMPTLIFSNKHPIAFYFKLLKFFSVTRLLVNVTGLSETFQK